VRGDGVHTTDIGARADVSASVEAPFANGLRQAERSAVSYQPSAIELSERAG